MKKTNKHPKSSASSLRVIVNGVRGVKNEAVRRLQNVQITGGRPLPLMPRQTTRMFGFCGLSPQLLQEMTAAVPAA